MYKDALMSGSALPPGTLCLTFDDGPGETTGPGPGPRTLELAQYLNAEGVRATFFCVGKYASDLPEVLPEVEALGHLIANHSYDHPNLVEYAAEGGDVASQIARTDGLIRNWIDAPIVYVRPPYGAWDAIVAEALNASLTTALSHLGPIGWEIDGGDWACWRDGLTPNMCMARYLTAIDAQKRGIVLLHDCTADQEIVKQGNRTLETVQLLVPELKRRDYRFVRLDDVPGLDPIPHSSIRLALRGYNGLYVSPQGGGGGPILVNGPGVGPWEPLVVEDLYVGKVGLRATSGHYISPQGGGGGDVLADGPAVGPWEPLDLISLGSRKVAFRTTTGDYLVTDPAAGGPLKASGSWLSIAPESVFTYEFVP